MAVVNFKAVGVGASAFLVCYLIYSFAVGFDSQGELGTVGFWLLPIFVAPGFIAGAVAKRHGVINGAAVGVVVGLIALVVFLFPFQGQTSGAFGVATVFGASVVLFSSLGGLLWHAYSAIHRVWRRGP